MSFKKIAIITLHPHNYGGVLAIQKNVYDFCARYFEPTLFFLGFGADISTSLKRGKFNSRVRHTSYFGMQSVEIGARWAFWEPGHYAYTLKSWKKELEGYDYFFVVSGTPIVAHPLVLLNKKFVGLYASPHESDRTQRMGDKKGIRAFLEKRAHPRMLKIEKEILQKNDVVLPMSDYTRRQFESILGGPRDKMELCPYPIASEKIGMISNHTVKKEKIIITVGRYDDPRKNIGMLLRVFEAVVGSVPNAKLYVIGACPSQQTLQEYAAKPFFKSVIFTGFVEQAELDLFYQRADLMLITSHQEGFGIVGLEALARGVPVISTDCGGTRDFVIEGKTGYLVDVNDDEAMIKKVVLLLTDADEHARLRLQGPLFVQDHFSQQAVDEIYKKSLSTVYPELAELFTSSDVVKKDKAREVLI